MKVAHLYRILLALLFLVPLAVYYVHPYNLVPAAILVLAVPYFGAVMLSITGRNRKGSLLYQFVWMLVFLFIAVWLLGVSGHPYVYASAFFFVFGELIAKALEKSARLGR